jgi:hypothetical protein
VVRSVILIIPREVVGRRASVQAPCESWDRFVHQGYVIEAIIVDSEVNYRRCRINFVHRKCCDLKCVIFVCVKFYVQI